MYRRYILPVLAMVFSCSTAHAGLVTQHNDATLTGASTDGVISSNEYGPGNQYAFTGAGTGFAGQLGNATLRMKSDTANLYLGFSNLGVHNNDDRIVVYFNTRPGGLQPNGADMNDGVAFNTDDAGRRNVSILSESGTETVNFNGGSPDYALLFRNNSSFGFVALFELKPAGQAHVFIPVDHVGLGSSVLEIKIPLTDLGITSGDAVEFAALQISNTGFLSDEGIPAVGFSGNPGFNNSGNIAFTNYHRFVTAQTFPYTGITERKPNVTLNFPPIPPAPSTNSYATVNAFPGLIFTNPLAIAQAPGETNRLYIVERAGRIIVITNMMIPTRTQFMHLPGINTSSEGGLLGLAFHPGYATNRQFFVFYTPNANNGTGNGFHTRVSRFERTATNMNLALPATEVVLYSQYNRDSNHNGGDIHFGPDGYLYIAVGDEGGFNDTYNNGQKIDDSFFAGLLRIDVDKKPGSLAPNHHPALGGNTNYAIPPDNPFIGITNYYGSNIVSGKVRTEFYAKGLRNPFRFHIDKVNGQVYVADVGQDAWEEVNLVTNGGNYGWAAREAFVNGPKPSGFLASAYANPILAYSHGTGTNQGRSITGGMVYRGNRFPELVGHYIFADYVSGNIWSLTHNGVTNTSFRWLANDNNLVSFGEDPLNGDVLICDISANQIKRLVYATASSNALPATLADAGIFNDMDQLTTYEGIVPYDVSLPFWSDGALKYRWFSLPDTNLQFGFHAETPWHAPPSAIWIKHFDILLTSGVPSSARRLETRVLVKNDTGNGGYGVTYRWGSSTENAVLVQDQGLDEEIIINDSGIIRTQVWRYPSRSECMICHNAAAGFALSFNSPQMNTVHDFGDVVTNQIAALRNAGYFSNTVDNIHLLRKLAKPDETEYSVAYRARSYLQANCAQCHFPGGLAPNAFDTRLFTPLSQAGLLEGSLSNNGGDPDNRVIARGSVPHSMIHTRINQRGGSQMPPVGSNLVDTQNVALIAAWINGEAAGYETFAEWQIRHFGATNIAQAQAGFDADGDGNINYLEWLTGTQPTNHLDAWEITTVGINGEIPALVFDRMGGAGFDVQVTTNLIDGAWTSLDVPQNAPVFSAGTTMAVVPDPEGTNLVDRYYRVNIYEP